MEKSQNSIQDVHYNQNHIYGILNILYEFSKSNYFYVCQFDVNHVCNLEQTGYQSNVYQQSIIHKDLNQEW